MKGYTARKVLSAEELRLWDHATVLVERIPELRTLRCHELARAVGHVIGLPVQDGKFGIVEHSWLWLPGEPLPDTTDQLSRWPNILDTYMPGAFPIVQAVYTGMPLPHVQGYKLGPDRDDIDVATVEWLLKLMRDPREAAIQKRVDEIREVARPDERCPGCNEPKGDGRCLACGFI